jgi:3-keto-disaccharide hydrolase
MKTNANTLGLGLGLLLAPMWAGADEAGFVALFTEDGIPKGWTVRQWDDVRKPAGEGVVWKVVNGVLHGSEPRGTWLMSEKEYGDFVLELEWKLGEQGNSGTALRAPMFGDPAFDGMELQMVDPRYYGGADKVTPAELTGSLYLAVAPRVQVFKPTEWNKYQITCKGRSVKVMLNGEKILDVNLDEETKHTKRHDGTDAPGLKDRPHKGHIGFQELSRGGGHVEIRNVRIKVLN